MKIELKEDTFDIPHMCIFTPIQSNTSTISVCVAVETVP